MQIDYPVNGRLMTFYGPTEKDLRRYCTEVIGDAEYGELVDAAEVDITVVDVGACLGTFSAWIYDRAKIIYALEPSASNFEHLLMFVEKNKLDKIWLFNQAIAGAMRPRILHENGDCGSYTIVEDRSPDVYEWVAATTLAHMFETVNTIDLLKIDVEGAEEEIFSGPDFHKIAPRIKHIIGEAHATDVKALLSPHGFDVEVMTDAAGHRLFSALPTALSAPPSPVGIGLL